VLCGRTHAGNGWSYVPPPVSQGGGNALVIVMSAYGGEDAAIAAMKEGAYDYLTQAVSAR